MRALILAFAIALPVSAQGYREPRHEGFFLRLDLGLGYFNSTASSGGIDSSISGLGAGLGIAIGGNIAPNLAIYGHLFDAVVANPTIKVGSSSGSTNNTSAGIGGLGVGLTYYIMPLNVFLAGTVGFGPLSFSNNGTNSSTQNGLVGRFGLGKEWFVSQSWGLGIAGYVNFGVNPDQGTNPPTWKTVAPLVALSATFY